MVALYFVYAGYTELTNANGSGGVALYPNATYINGVDFTSVIGDAFYSALLTVFVLLVDIIQYYFEMEEAKYKAFQ